MSLQVKHFYRFGPFDLDAEQRLVRCDQTKITLPPKAFDLLLYMVKNPLRLLTKEELLRAVWPDSFVEEGNLSQNIFLLRKALTTPTKDSRYIVTIPGRGYQFASAVEVVAQRPQSGTNPGDDSDLVLNSVCSRMHIVVHEEIDDASSSALTERMESRRTGLSSPRRRKNGLRGAVAGLLLLAVAAGSFFWWRGHRRQPSSQAIVLADFENQTGDAAFDVALKKALEIDLGQSPYLDVMSEKQASDMLQLMGRKRDAALTLDIAAEICQRSNRQVMLDGSISSLGRDYLLTLQATDCASGRKLAESKAEAASKEKVLGALDFAAEKIRHRLGESGQSVEQFQVPIAQATTSSLEALKAYSIGEYMVNREGKEETETLPVFQRAVELDPQFAMAYAAIATDYYNLSEYELAKPYYQKAFDLSGQVSEREKLYIRAHYYADGIKDAEQGIKQYKLLTETYPRDWGPWINIANEYTQLGQYAPAIAAGEHALQMDPSPAISYSVLARAYMRANRFADARFTGLRAVAIGKDTYGLHATMFQIAFVEHDQAAMSREIAWNRGRSSAWFSLDSQAFAAAAVGKYKQAEELYHSAYDVAERGNLTETADEILVDEATMEFELGLPGVARGTLKGVSQQGADDPDLIFLNAELGERSSADHFLATPGGANHSDTLLNCVYVPRLRSELALQRDKPLEALAALEPASPYEFAGGFTIIGLRGEAYLRSGQMAKATLEYQKILSHQGVDPVSPLFPLAHLSLARIDAKAARLPESRTEYETFFAVWKDADENLPVFLAARREYAALTTNHP